MTYKTKSSGGGGGGATSALVLVGEQVCKCGFLSRITTVSNNPETIEANPVVALRQRSINRGASSVTHVRYGVSQRHWDDIREDVPHQGSD